MVYLIILGILFVAFIVFETLSLVAAKEWDAEKFKFTGAIAIIVVFGLLFYLLLFHRPIGIALTKTFRPTYYATNEQIVAELKVLSEQETISDADLALYYEYLEFSPMLDKSQSQKIVMKNVTEFELAVTDPVFAILVNAPKKEEGSEE